MGAGARDRLGTELEQEVPASERHGRGQYFTPNLLVDFVLGLLPSSSSRGIVLDPSCGTGRFLLAAAERWPTVGLRGFETDPRALDAARAQLPGAALRAADFLQEAPVGDVDLVLGNPPYVRGRGSRRDLYVDFVESALHHLRDGGRLALVLSNAWLDVGYGRHVRELLLERCAVEWLVESSVERWFPGASVNTMVLVARRCDDPAERAAAPVRFGQVRSPLPACPTVLRTVRQGELGLDEAWGPLLRASDLFLETRARSVPLGELAELQRGWTTNDNAFFYPPEGSGIEPEWLCPVLKSPRRSPGVRFSGASLPDRALVCSLTREELKHRGQLGLLRWIDRHGRADWKLQSRPPARLFLVKGHHDRFRTPLADEPVRADQQLYLLRPVAGLSAEAMAGLLNSSWAWLCAELAGRVNFGDGVLWLGLQDARSRIGLPDLRGLPSEVLRGLESSFAALPSGPVPSASLLEGDPNWGPARLALDARVGELLGLEEPEVALLRAEALALCQRRLAMAASARGSRSRARRERAETTPP